MPDAWIMARQAYTQAEGDPEAAPEAAWWGGSRPVLSDASGRFEVRGLRAGKRYDLAAEAGGARAHRRGVRPGEDVVLRLRPLGGVAGRVSAGGQPVTDYQISLEGPVRQDKRARGPDGRYAFARLDAGRYKVAVSSDAGARVAEVVIAAGATATLDLALSPWGEVSGRVVDALSGEPIRGATVLASAHEVADPGDTAASVLTGAAPKTDAEGRFRVGRLGPGRGSLAVMPGGLLAGFEPVATASFTLEPGEKKDLGTIKALPGKPVKPQDAGDLGLLVRDEDGRVVVKGVVPDSAAAAAGIGKGDVIVAIDGHAVASIGAEVAIELLDFQRVRAGQVVVLDVERAGATQRLSLTARPLKLD